MIYYFVIINLLTYIIMWVDKLKSIYKWWRIPEKTLWIFALIGGVFGIWLGMMAPLYHKAGKAKFKLWIPVIAILWAMIGLCYDIEKEISIPHVNQP